MHARPALVSLASEQPKPAENLAVSALDFHELAAAALSLVAGQGRRGVVADKLTKIYGQDPARGIALAIAQAVATAAGQALAAEQLGQGSGAFFEPWRQNGVELEVNDERFAVESVRESGFELELEHLVPGVLRRIVACVNFCQGITTEAIEQSIPLAGYQDEKGGVL